MTLITHKQIRKILKKEYPDIRNIWLFDKQYCAPSKKEFQEILNKIAPIEVQYQDELFDCDDYALVTSAFVKMKAVGISFGEITVRHITSKEIHSLNILITEDKKMHYFEPQAKLFVSGKEYRPFFVRI